MIKSKLNIILAERNLSVSDLAKRTGISRTTLTGLTKNHSAGIQYDTLNKICMNLRVQPKDMFEYLPFDIEVRNEHSSNSSDEIIFRFSITTSNKIDTFFIVANIQYSIANNTIDEIDSAEFPYVSIYLSKFINETDEDQDEDEKLNNFLKSLTPTFFKDFESMIIGETKDFINFPDEEIYKIQIDWDPNDFPMF